jgi:CysZ protein
MKAINNHIYAFRVTIEALSKGKLFVYFIPGLIVALIYLYFRSWTSSAAGAAESLSDVWLVGGVLSSVAHGFFGLIDFLLFQFYVFIVLIILAPFNGLLAEKFDNHLTGNKFDGGIVRMMNDLLRAVFIALIALLLELATLFIWWIISFVIPFGFIDTIMSFLITSFFFGFAFYDYGLERYGEGTFASIAFAFGNMLHMILTGAVFTLIYYIPVLGVFLAPLMATMVATATYLKMRGANMPPEPI